jgi:transglutaminase-like putative cysteine protease
MLSRAATSRAASSPPGSHHELHRMNAAPSVARYRITHVSRYRYDQDVGASFNEARLNPVSTRWQSPLESTLRIEEATWHYQYVDYWGTQVRVFEVTRAHRELVVSASSLVEVDPSGRPRPQRSVEWSELTDAAVLEQMGEYLAQTPSTVPPDDLGIIAAEIAGRCDPHAAALAISTAVYEQMTYLPGSTGVYTPAADAWVARSGVCQDYAHLVVGALRRVGIPARYVSGYLHPSKNPELGEPAVGESHAWVEWWLGEWVAHDPTNNAEVADRHIMIGSGRDYGDVPPIKGIVAGSPVATDLQVEVEITRMV